MPIVQRLGVERFVGLGVRRRRPFEGEIAASGRDAAGEADVVGVAIVSLGRLDRVGGALERAERKARPEIDAQIDRVAAAADVDQGQTVHHLFGPGLIGGGHEMAELFLANSVVARRDRERHAEGKAFTIKTHAALILNLNRDQAFGGNVGDRRLEEVGPVLIDQPCRLALGLGLLVDLFRFLFAGDETR